MAIVIRRLEKQDEVEGFDCGDEPLNNYLKRHAWTNQEKSSIGVTYVAVDEGAPQSVLGYFTLAMASVPRDAFPKKHVRGLPLYDLPLILLARLAVDGRFAGRGNWTRTDFGSIPYRSARRRGSGLPLHRHVRIPGPDRLVFALWFCAYRRCCGEWATKDVS